jgi:hypothetical protein
MAEDAPDLPTQRRVSAAAATGFLQLLQHLVE